MKKFIIALFVTIAAIMPAPVYADEEEEQIVDPLPATIPDPEAGMEFYFFADRATGLVYWVEYGYIQGRPGDPLNITDTIYGVERGREIYDPETAAWYWLDANNGGAVAYSKEVWFPYIYQDEEPGSTLGKWVEYDQTGAMVKGWKAIEDDEDGDGIKEKYLCYHDETTGELAKGKWTFRDNFDEENPVEIQVFFDRQTGRAPVSFELLSYLSALHGEEWPVYIRRGERRTTLAAYIAEWMKIYNNIHHLDE